MCPCTRSQPRSRESPGDTSASCPFLAGQEVRLGVLCLGVLYCLSLYTFFFLRSLLSLFARAAPLLRHDRFAAQPSGHHGSDGNGFRSAPRVLFCAFEPEGHEFRMFRSKLHREKKDPLVHLLSLQKVVRCPTGGFVFSLIFHSRSAAFESLLDAPIEVKSPVRRKRSICCAPILHFSSGQEAGPETRKQTHEPHS